MVKLKKTINQNKRKLNPMPHFLIPGIHEFTHALGFSSSLYAHYIDMNNVPYTAPTFVENQVGNGVTYEVVKMSTPKVVQTAREHFNCPTLNGVELENSGGSGTAGELTTPTTTTTAAAQIQIRFYF